MKRFSALFLSALLVMSLLIFPVLAEGISPAELEMPVIPSAEAVSSESQEETSSDEALLQNPTPAEPDASDTTDLSAISIQSATSPAKNTATSLRFQELSSVLKKYNSNIRALDASLADIKTSGTGDLENAVSSMENLRDSFDTVMNTVTQMGSNPDLPEDQKLIYQALSMSMGVSIASIRSQISALQNQIDSVNTTLKTTKNTLNNSIYQIIKGAETLYIGIVTMENSMEGINRGIAALDRAVAITEKQVQLGMASQYDLETVKHQRTQAASGLQALQFQIKTSKITLESMCDMPANGTVKLETLPLPSHDELSIVNYSENLSSVTAKNVEVQNADIKRHDEDDTTHDANERTYEAAVDTFAYKYQIICLTVPEKNRLVETAQETVDYQQKTLKIAEKKYSLGMLSHEELLAEQNNFQTATDDMFNAQLELFTAYRNYIWATSQGIV